MVAGELLAAGVGDTRRLWALWVASGPGSSCILPESLLCVVSSFPLSSISFCLDGFLNTFILADPAADALYCRCRYSFILCRCPWVRPVGVLILPPPPSRAPLGVSFFVGFVACLGSSLRKKWFGLPTLSTPGCRLSGSHLSLQMSPPSSWLSPSLFLVVTGAPRVFQFTETSSDARPWTHHQCCFQESLGVSGLTTDNPSPGDPTEADQTPACVQVAFYCPHCSPLFNQSHLDAFSAASTLLPMALLRLAPVMPSVP